MVLPVVVCLSNRFVIAYRSIFMLMYPNLPSIGLWRGLSIFSALYPSVRILVKLTHTLGFQALLAAPTTPNRPPSPCDSPGPAPLGIRPQFS